MIEGIKRFIKIQKDTANVFPLGNNDLDKDIDPITSEQKKKIAFFKNFAFNALQINANSTAYFWFTIIGDKIVSCDIYKLWNGNG